MTSSSFSLASSFLFFSSGFSDCSFFLWLFLLLDRDRCLRLLLRRRGLSFDEMIPADTKTSSSSEELYGKVKVSGERGRLNVSFNELIGLFLCRRYCCNDEDDGDEVNGRL